MKEQVMGIVLSAATIGEYDKRVVLLTKERGRISAFARGARRPRSPLSASTEPFTFGVFFIYKGRNSYTIEQVEVRNFFPELRKDLDALYRGMYFCEVADYFTREGMEAKQELNLLYLSFRALSVPSISKTLVRYIFELRMLAIEGEAPRIFECIRCGGTSGLHHFHVEEAGIVCEDCQKGEGAETADFSHPKKNSGNGAWEGITLSETGIYTLQRIVSSPLEKLYNFTVSDSVLEEIGKVIGRYFSSRTDREFKSLGMLEFSLENSDKQ